MLHALLSVTDKPHENCSMFIQAVDQVLGVLEGTTKKLNELFSYCSFNIPCCLLGHRIAREIKDLKCIADLGFPQCWQCNPSLDESKISEQWNHHLAILISSKILPMVCSLQKRQKQTVEKPLPKNF